jgi:hypothetical protein
VQARLSTLCVSQGTLRLCVIFFRPFDFSIFDFRPLYSLLPIQLLTALGRLTKPHPSFNVKCFSDT